MNKFAIEVLVVLASAVLFVDSAKAGEYTYLQYARGEMYITRQILETTKIKLHGHRDTALTALKEAIAEVDAALRSVGVTTYVEAPFIKAKGLDRLPESLKVMREARDKLSQAGKGFERHRARAVRALDVAIKELDAGIDKMPEPKTKGGKKRALKK
ncbi:MAG: hypothetical protein FJ395_21865 [Verrucomicrobia bacterium]|nr:hypothetical protein [Verrucomicrobiota bacterium]